jgi:hypothetical protein
MTGWPYQRLLYRHLYLYILNNPGKLGVRYATDLFIS